jgi:hypothetical protein
MKTGVEWLATMPYKLQVLFLKRLSECGKYIGLESIAGYLNYEFTDFHDFICGGFRWSDTAEGHDYWSLIANERYK